VKFNLYQYVIFSIHICSILDQEFDDFYIILADSNMKRRLKQYKDLILIFSSSTKAPSETRNSTTSICCWETAENNGVS